MPSTTEQHELLIELTQTSYVLVLRYFLHQGFPFETSQDLTQETFLNAWRGIARGTDLRSPRAWILTIARNVCRKAVRDNRGATRMQAADPPDERVPDRRLDDPLQQLIDQETMRIVANAINELPERMRRCVLLKARDDLSYEQIGEVMRIKKGTVGAMLNKAKKLLRKKLSGQIYPIGFFSLEN